MNMKICPRYLSPESPFSERGLVIASLKVQTLYDISMFSNLSLRAESPFIADILEFNKVAKIVKIQHFSNENINLAIQKYFVYLQIADRCRQNR